MNKLRNLTVLGLAVATLSSFSSTVDAATPSVLDGNYYNKSVTINGDGSSAVSKISVGSFGSYKTYEASKITVSSEDTYDVKVFYSDGRCDNCGFTIDKTKPTSSAKILKSTSDTTNVNKYSNNARVTIRFTDSNLSTVKVGSKVNEANSSSYSVQLKEYSNKTVDVVATDKAGNKSTVRCVFGNTKPVFKSIKNGLITNKGIRLKTNNTSDKLYVDGQYYSDEYVVNADGSKSGKVPYHQGYLLTAEGKHTLTAKSVDGNRSSIKVTIDYTKSKCNIKNNQTVKKGFKLKCSDSLSGLDSSKCRLKYEGTIASDFSNPNKSYKLSKKGDYILTLQDKAGNKRTYKFKVN